MGLETWALDRTIGFELQSSQSTNAPAPADTVNTVAKAHMPKVSTAVGK